jgi:hypothetical protein
LSDAKSSSPLDNVHDVDMSDSSLTKDSKFSAQDDEAEWERKVESLYPESYYGPLNHLNNENQLVGDTERWSFSSSTAQGHAPPPLSSSSSSSLTGRGLKVPSHNGLSMTQPAPPGSHDNSSSLSFSSQSGANRVAISSLSLEAQKKRAARAAAIKENIAAKKQEDIENGISYVKSIHIGIILKKQTPNRSITIEDIKGLFASLFPSFHEKLQLKFNNLQYLNISVAKTLDVAVVFEKIMARRQIISCFFSMNLKVFCPRQEHGSVTLNLAQGISIKKMKKLIFDRLGIPFSNLKEIIMYTNGMGLSGVVVLEYTFLPCYFIDLYDPNGNEFEFSGNKGSWYITYVGPSPVYTDKCDQCLATGHAVVRCRTDSEGNSLGDIITIVWNNYNEVPVSVLPYVKLNAFGLKDIIPPFTKSMIPNEDEVGPFVIEPIKFERPVTTSDNHSTLSRLVLEDLGEMSSIIDIQDGPVNGYDISIAPDFRWCLALIIHGEEFVRMSTSWSVSELDLVTFLWKGVEGFHRLEDVSHEEALVSSIQARAKNFLSITRKYPSICQRLRSFEMDEVFWCVELGKDISSTNVVNWGKILKDNNKSFQSPPSSLMPKPQIVVKRKRNPSDDVIDLTSHFNTPPLNHTFKGMEATNSNHQ